MVIAKNGVEDRDGSLQVERAARAHILPFVAWLAVMLLPGAPTAWMYAVRTATGLAALLWARPWSWYAAPRAANLPLAVGAGALVTVLWVAMETSWAGRWCPLLQSAYLRFAVDLFPAAQVQGVAAGRCYAPETCGWVLTSVRLLGSAMVIAPIEEFFWRGFVYRWLVGRPFLGVALGRFRWGAFAVTALLFGLEHDRWLVGILAGVVYGALLLKTRDIWAAVVAHVVTNLLLGFYVLAAGAYTFW